MLALHEIKTDVCPGCGGVLSETTDPANEFGYKAEAHRCHRCHAIADEQERYRDPKTTQHPGALLWVARLLRRG